MVSVTNSLSICVYVFYILISCDISEFLSPHDIFSRDNEWTSPPGNSCIPNGRSQQETKGLN